MSDASHHGTEGGPSHRTVEVSTAIAMVAFGAIVIYGSLQVGIGWGAEGPKAGFFPFYIGVAIIIASVFNALTAATQDARKLFADWSQLGSVLQIVIPTAIYVIAIPFIGIYVSSIVLIALFMKWLGRYGIVLSLVISVGVMVGTFLMFEKWFLVPLPKGPIEDWLGF
jgi:hypothetical protein